MPRLRRLRTTAAVLLPAALSAVALVAVPATAAEVGAADHDAPLVLRFEPGTSAEERKGDLEARGLVVVDSLPGSDHVLVVEEPGTYRSAGLAEDTVAEVAPVVELRAFGTAPDDPAYPYQWHLPAIGAASAWEVTTGIGATVAVLDTGVAVADDGVHRRAPDLAGTRVAPGWDFVDGDARPNDEHGHGTHVAGAIAQTTGNGIGAAGVAPGATILPVRVLDERGVGTDWDIARGIRFAVDNGADVVNLSLGADTSSSVIAGEIAHALASGVTVVAASGNDGRAQVSFPASLDGVIAVGATRYDGTRPAYGNHGARLDLVAPGGDLGVDQDGNGYADGILQQTLRESTPGSFCLCFLQGTSMAAPQVSAVAALLASRGVTDPATIGSILRSTARDLGAPGRDDVFGAGLLQADAAVRAPLPTRQAPPAPASQPVAGAAGPAPSGVRGIDHACPEGSTPSPSFTDLDASVHRRSVGCVVWWEIAEGRSADRYEPDAPVTRAQMASFVARLLDATGADLPMAPADAFADDAASPHAWRIDQLAEVGIVRGRDDGTYGPDAVVTRAEMATFLLRAHDLVAGDDLPMAADRFRDDDTSVHGASIDRVAGAGLAAGTTSTTFDPAAPVLRGQMASFLARTLDRLVEGGVRSAA